MLRGEANGVTGRDIDGWNNPASGGNGGHEHAEVAREADGDGGDGAGLDNKEQRPAVKETPERTVGFAQIDVLASRTRHHSGEFAVTQRGDDGEDAGDQPHHEQPTGRTDLAGDVGGDDEDAGTDHRAGDDHR